jgi:hypothetical protein
MSRLAWILPIAAVLALTLVSCFDDVGDALPRRAVAPSRRRGSERAGGLGPREAWTPAPVIDQAQGGSASSRGAGTHAVETTRFLNDQGIVSSRAETINLHLERGESRTILFHNDFPLITWIVRPGWASA